MSATTPNNPANNPANNPRPKLRLVHCIGSMRVGGAERQLSELIRRLPRERFEQSLVLLREEGALLDVVRSTGCEIFSLDYGQRFRSTDPRCYAALLRVLWRYVRFLRRRRPHILHAQLYWANQLSVLAGRLAGVPVIITSRLQLSDYKEGRPLLQRLENLANRGTTAIFANSQAVRRDMLEHERVNPNIIKIIYNAVVLDDYHAPDVEPLRREFNIRPDELVLVAVANLHRYKGHEELIRATKALMDRGHRLRLLLPGADRGYRSHLEALVAELGVGDRVHLPGERHDIAAFQALSDIVIHPSHQEGFSNAILEAMTAGKPMIVTNVGGNPEAVRDGENGLLVPPRDAAALQAALERLIGDPELRRRMGEASRRRIEQEFSFDRLVGEFSAWYESLARRT
jgi:glycosyltransferase involved in cell wall biosynthesis